MPMPESLTTSYVVSSCGGIALRQAKRDISGVGNRGHLQNGLLAELTQFDGPEAGSELPCVKSGKAKREAALSG